MSSGINGPALMLATGLIAGLVSVASARTIYDCTFETLAVNMGWVPTSVAVADDAETEAVQVIDPMINDVHGEPITVTPTTNSDGVLSLSWKLVLDDIRGDGVPVRYDLTIYKSDNRAKIRAEPLGFRNDWASRGTCKVSKG